MNRFHYPERFFARMLSVEAIALSAVGALVVVKLVSVLLKRRGPWHRNWLDAEQYQEIHGYIESYFEEKGQKVVFLPDGDVEVSNPDGEAGGQISLLNLVQLLANTQRGYWRAETISFLDKIWDSMERVKRLEENSGDWESMRDDLVLRLAHREYLRTATRQTGMAFEENLVVRSEFGNLYTVLSVDLGESFAHVPRSAFEKWGVSQDEVFAGVMAKLSGGSTLPCEPISTERTDLPVVYVIGPDDLASTHALFLDKYADAIGPHGALVGIPTRNMVFAHPIGGPDAVPAVAIMIHLIDCAFREGPNSLSHELYWYKDGKFEAQPYKLRGKRVSFDPTERFNEMMRSLGPAEGNAGPSL